MGAIDAAPLRAVEGEELPPSMIKAEVGLGSANLFVRGKIAGLVAVMVAGNNADRHGQCMEDFPDGADLFHLPFVR